MHRIGSALSVLSVCSTLHAQVGVRDSAGVRIRDISPLVSSGKIRLGLTPTVDLGANGNAESEFHRIKSVVRQSDGSILVANTSTLQVRQFDSRGKFLRSFGGKGSGPGEFQSLDKMEVLAGDSILVADHMLRRFTVFSPTGVVQRTVVIRPPFKRRVPDVVSVFHDGKIVVGSSDVDNVSPRPQPYYFTQHIYVYGSVTGEPVSEVGVFPQSEHFAQATPPEMGGTAYWSLAYGRTLTVATVDSRILVGDGTTFELRYYLPGGKLNEVVRSAEKPPLLTQLDKDAFRTKALEGEKGAGRLLTEKMLDAMPYPATIPAFKTFFVAEDGLIWIERYPRPIAKGEEWVVMDARGNVVDVLQMPRRFHPYYAGRGYVAGVGRDDDDVEHVWVFAVSSGKKP